MVWNGTESVKGQAVTEDFADEPMIRIPESGAVC